MKRARQDSADLFGDDDEPAGEAPRRHVAYVPEVPIIRFTPCQHCGAPILRVVEDRGNPMRVEPHASGPYVVDGVGPLGRPLVRNVSGANEVLRRAVVVIRKLARGETRYQSHYATCPERGRWGKMVVTDPLQAAALAAEPGR